MSAKDADAHRRHFGSVGCWDITCTSCVRQREGSPFKVAYFDDLKIGDVIHQWSMDGVTFRDSVPVEVLGLQRNFSGELGIAVCYQRYLHRNSAVAYMIAPAAVVPAIRNV